MDITKLEAARRQLETALSLYFHEGDPVSIHTLTAAAHEVLTDINRHAGADPMLFDLAAAWIKTEHRRDFKDSVHKAQNFFKHADRDHDGVLEHFDIQQAQILLMDACFAYERIAGERPPLMVLYYVWARFTFGHEWLKYDLDGSDVFKKLPDPTLVTQLQSLSRHSFYIQVLPAVQAWLFGSKP